MRISAMSMLFLVVLAFCPSLPAQNHMPMMRSVEPASAKVGDVLEIEGENLGPEIVAVLYLTDGETDVKVPMVEQKATSIKFRIPSEVKPGRFTLMVLTRDKPPRLIEEPVKVTIEPETSASNPPSSREGAVRLL